MNFAPQQSPSRQVSGIAFVVLLHVAVVYALISGLGRQAIEVLRQPLETKIVQEDKPPPPDQPPPPPPKLAPPPPAFVPPPEINVAQAPVANAISAVTTVKPVEPAPVARAEPPPAPAPVPVAQPVRVAPVVDAAHSCRPPEYPSASRRLEETGASGLLFLVGTDGGVVDAKVENSSGHPRLDEAAVAALSKCKFKPGTVDGKPEQAWARLRYVWKLE